MRLEQGRVEGCTLHSVRQSILASVITLLSFFSQLMQAQNDNTVINMTPTQSRMARAALRWTISDLAQAANVGRATAARFELGEGVSDDVVAKMRGSLEDAGAVFVASGRHAGGVVPPSVSGGEDQA